MAVPKISSSKIPSVTGIVMKALLCPIPYLGIILIYNLY
ncbi:hypothetical protein SBBP2_650027 [Burkholderiales bacterium]|nr:hypothetical protein SBBP2_650027 [Burkholderiales bacterium]